MSQDKLPFKAIDPILRKYGPCVRGRILIVEGLISAGKSTAGKAIVELLQSVDVKVKFFPEPILMGLLKLFLSDPSKYAFAFQLAMLVKRQAIYKEARKLADQGYFCVIDRSLYGDYCFALVHKNRGNIKDVTTLDDNAPTEWKAYMETLRSEEFQHPDYVIYLKVTPEIAIKRCKRRDRDGEKAYDIEYFKELCTTYDAVIPSSPSHNTIQLDWNEDRSYDQRKIATDILDVVKNAYNRMN